MPAVIVVLEQLPLNANGKTDRKALPEPEGRPQGLQYEPPRTQLEQVLAQIWSQVLRVEQVGVQDDFFELGGHSLLAMRVVAAVRDQLHVELPVRLMFEAPTVRSLAGRLGYSATMSAGLAIPPLTKQVRPQVLPLSHAQERLWFLEQIGLVGAAYNMPMPFRLYGILDIAALERGVWSWPAGTKVCARGSW